MAAPLHEEPRAGRKPPQDRYSEGGGASPLESRFPSIDESIDALVRGAGQGAFGDGLKLMRPNRETGGMCTACVKIFYLQSESLPRNKSFVT